MLEAEICGHGPSGRNGGFVHGYWAALASLRQVLGDADAVRLCRAAEEVVPGVRAFAESRGEDVWLREAGMVMVSAAPAQDPAVEHAVEAAAAVDRPDQAVALSADDVAVRCASPVFRRGVFFPDGATVHPGFLVRALRRAVLAAGVDLYERTPALRVHAGAPNTIETPGGVLRARDVVLATNAALTGWRPAGRSLTNFGSYVVLTEPAPELLQEIGWTGGEAVVDARMFLHYFRTTPDGRVLMGSGSGPIGFGGKIDARFSADQPTAARAEAGLRRLLPGLDAARVQRAWGGPIDVSADHLPFFRTKPGTRIHYGAGYSGHGVGPSWLGGADPRLARARRRRRVDATAARDAAPAGTPAGAAPPPRRRPRTHVDHGVRSSGRAGPPRPAGRARGCGIAAPLGNGARYALGGGFTAATRSRRHRDLVAVVDACPSPKLVFLGRPWRRRSSGRCRASR